MGNTSNSKAGMGSPEVPDSLLYGTLDILILKALSWTPMHGYSISNWIRERSDGAVDLEDAALYKALHRLEREGAIKAQWGRSENNRKAKYYLLTPVGERHLHDRITSWRHYAGLVNLMLDTR
jgi:PadR family transcriptional regulator, regulatory protein PadR